MAITPRWTDIRTFVAQAAEGHAAAPADGVFVVPPEPHGVDLMVSFEGCAFANAPNSGTFWIWSLHNDGVHAAVKEKLAEVIVAGAESPWMMPVTLRSGPALIYVTIDAFNGGAAPTVSGVVKMRRVSQKTGV